MECFRKCLILIVVYTIFFIVPWFCGFALMWELHEDVSSWSIENNCASVGTKGSLILAIFLFICAVEILVFGTKVFVIPVILEIIIFSIYAIGLDITNDWAALLTIPLCCLLKLFYLLWKWYEAKIKKANKQQDCVSISIPY